MIVTNRDSRSCQVRSFKRESFNKMCKLSKNPPIIIIIMASDSLQSPVRLWVDSNGCEREFCFVSIYPTPWIIRIIARFFDEKTFLLTHDKIQNFSSFQGSPNWHRVVAKDDAK